MEDRLRTIAQEKAHLAMMRELRTLEVDVRDWKLRQALIPAEWHAIERTVPVRPRRKKVTVALDADVAKWFQGLGEGYHRRINAVLRTFMLALISKRDPEPGRHEPARSGGIGEIVEMKAGRRASKRGRFADSGAGFARAGPLPMRRSASCRTALSRARGSRMRMPREGSPSAASDASGAGY